MFTARLTCGCGCGAEMVEETMATRMVDALHIGNHPYHTFVRPEPGTRLYRCPACRLLLKVSEPDA